LPGLHCGARCRLKCYKESAGIPAIQQAKTGKVAPSQLTAAKLERLMDRYAGKEWLSSKLSHLDEAASEKADVLRGLRTSVKANPANAEMLADLYDKPPTARKELDAVVVKELAEK
jgi:hypothetical protein